MAKTFKDKVEEATQQRREAIYKHFKELSEQEVNGNNYEDIGNTCLNPTFNPYIED
jgi:hypothetical protein